MTTKKKAAPKTEPVKKKEVTDDTLARNDGTDISIRITLIENGTIGVEFNREIQWMAFTPLLAYQLGVDLIRHAGIVEHIQGELGKLEPKGEA